MLYAHCAAFHANLFLQLWTSHTLQACCRTCTRACLPAWMLENTLPRVLMSTLGLKRSSRQRRRRALPWLPARWSPTETTLTSEWVFLLPWWHVGGVPQASGLCCCWGKAEVAMTCTGGVAVPHLCYDACYCTSLQDLWPAVRPTSSLDGGRLPAAAYICHHPSSSRRR